MNTLNKVITHIQSIPKGRAFASSTLKHLATPTNTRKILERLTKQGELRRIARGIYARPKKTQFGEVLPSHEEIARVSAQAHGEVIAVHGAVAAQQLGLTTQVPMQPIYYTTGNSRTIKTNKQTIILIHISPSKLVNPGTIVCTVISALWYMGNKNVSIDTINKIEKQLTKQDFTLVLQHREFMPAWMAHQFHRHQQQGLNHNAD